jgi:hypothetical protein
MSWSDWASLGGSLDGDPAVGSNQDSRLEVFVKGKRENVGTGSQQRLYHIWQNTPNGNWSSWALLYGNRHRPYKIGK